MNSYQALRELILKYQKQYDLSHDEAIKAIKADMKEIKNYNCFIYEVLQVGG